MDKQFDLICLGEVAVELNVEQLYCDLREAQTYRQYLGGCCANVAAGAANLGLRTVIVSRVGQDPLGVFIRNELMNQKVDTRWLKISDKHKTGAILQSLNSENKRSKIYYKDNSADINLLESDCEEDLFKRSKALYINGNSLATANMRNVCQYAIQLAKSYGQKTILDVRFTPDLWSGDEKRNIVEHYKFFVSQCDVVIIESDDISVLGIIANELPITEIRLLTSAIILSKNSDNSCTAYAADSIAPITVPGYELDVLNRAGKDEAFASSFIYSYLREHDLVDSVKRSNAASAIISSRHASAPEMPTLDEISRLTEPEIISKFDIFSKVKAKESRKEVCLLAFDQRYYFTPGTQVEIEKIREFKNILYKGFINSQTYRLEKSITSGLIVDDNIPENELREDTNAIICMPIESADSQLLKWISDRDLYSQILHRPKRWWVKVLVKIGPDMPVDKLEHQISMLSSLQEICHELDRTLLLDLSTTNVLWAMRYIFQNNIMPHWWKLPSEYEYITWKKIETLAGYYQDNPRIMILGGDVVSTKDLENSFATAKECSWVEGFAIGRNIFLEVFIQWSNGKISHNMAIEKLGLEYDRMSRLWSNASMNKTDQDAFAGV